MIRTLSALALAASLPLSAHAASVDYNYIQGGYASTHFVGTDFNGWNVKGSVAFNDMFYGVAAYDSVSKNSFDLSQTEVGLGYRHALSDSSDFVAELAYVSDDADVIGSDGGYKVSAGFRGMLSEKFEGSFTVNHTDVGDYGKGFGATLGGVVFLNDTWGIFASYDYSDRDSTNVDTWSVGLRAKF
jgi:hypothetical protein